MRPIEVTAVAVLVFIQAGMEALGGAGFVAGGLTTSGATIEGTELPPPALITVGVFSLVIAVIGVLVGVGLIRGSRVARLVVTVLQVASIVLSVIGFFATAHGQLMSDVLSLALAVVILAFLWSTSSSAFFNAKKQGSSEFA